MKKAKVTMRNWEPYVYDGEYNLSGTADVHPRLGRNVYVATTSTLVKASLEEDVLIYETRNTVYHCPLKYLGKCTGPDHCRGGKNVTGRAGGYGG